MLDLAAIRQLLPHGHPMLLIDRVLAIEPGASIVATKAITAGEPCYRDIPADAPAERYAYPTTLLLESFGQAAALLWLWGRGDERDGVPMLVAARDCRVTETVVPGDVLRHTARIDHVVGDHVFVEGETFVGERQVASVGSMMAAIRPRQALDHRPKEVTP